MTIRVWLGACDIVANLKVAQSSGARGWGRAEHRAWTVRQRATDRPAHGPSNPLRVIRSCVRHAHVEVQHCLGDAQGAETQPRAALLHPPATSPALPALTPTSACPLVQATRFPHWSAGPRPRQRCCQTSTTTRPTPLAGWPCPPPHPHSGQCQLQGKRAQGQPQRCPRRQPQRRRQPGCRHRPRARCRV